MEPAERTTATFRDSSIGEYIASTGFHAFAETAPVGCAVLGSAEGVIRYCNDLFRTCFRVESVRFGERFIDLAFGAGTRRFAIEQVDALLEEVARRRVPLLGIELQDVGDGGSAALNVSAWPLDGSLIAMMVRDATEEAGQRNFRARLIAQLREVNEQLLLSALREEELRVQAEASNAAKTTFVATMSHELRTPLAAIIGYSQLLHDGLTGPVSEEQQRQLDRILASANHLLAIINDVLSLSSADAALSTVRAEELDIRSLVEGTTSLIAPLAEGKALQFDMHFPDEPVSIHADGLKLRQILVNLLGNAVKFTDEGRVELNVTATEEAVTFEVRDTGIGIAPADVPKVFDTFWQAGEGSISRLLGGTGLGLSLSRNMARLMGGDIEVESKLGDGSAFRLVLPRH